MKLIAAVLVVVECDCGSIGECDCNRVDRGGCVGGGVCGVGGIGRGGGWVAAL